MIHFLLGGNKFGPTFRGELVVGVLGVLGRVSSGSQKEWILRVVDLALNQSQTLETNI